MNERNTIVCDFYLREEYSNELVEEEFATKGEISRRSKHRFTETWRSIFLQKKLKEERGKVGKAEFS